MFPMKLPLGHISTTLTEISPQLLCTMRTCKLLSKASCFSLRSCQQQDIPSSTIISWLVVYLPLWKMMDFVSWDDDIPSWMEKSSKCSKPPTSQVISLGPRLGFLLLQAQALLLCPAHLLQGSDLPAQLLGENGHLLGRKNIINWLSSLDFGRS